MPAGLRQTLVLVFWEFVSVVDAMANLEKRKRCLGRVHPQGIDRLALDAMHPLIHPFPRRLVRASPAKGFARVLPSDRGKRPPQGSRYSLSHR